MSTRERIINHIWMWVVLVLCILGFGALMTWAAGPALFPGVDVPPLDANRKIPAKYLPNITGVRPAGYNEVSALAVGAHQKNAFTDFSSRHSIIWGSQSVFNTFSASNKGQHTNMQNAINTASTVRTSYSNISTLAKDAHAKTAFTAFSSRHSAVATTPTLEQARLAGASMSGPYASVGTTSGAISDNINLSISPTSMAVHGVSGGGWAGKFEGGRGLYGSRGVFGNLSATKFYGDISSATGIPSQTLDSVLSQGNTTTREATFGNVTAVNFRSTSEVSARNLILSGPAGTNRKVELQSNGLKRWQYKCDDVTESGSDTGSDFVLNSFDDAGNFKFQPLRISRSTGTAVIPYLNTTNLYTTTLNGRGYNTPGKIDIREIGCVADNGVTNNGKKITDYIDAITAGHVVTLYFPGSETGIFGTYSAIRYTNTGVHVNFVGDGGDPWGTGGSIFRAYTTIPTLVEIGPLVHTGMDGISGMLFKGICLDGNGKVKTIWRQRCGSYCDIENIVLKNPIPDGAYALMSNPDAYNSARTYKKGLFVHFNSHVFAAITSVPTFTDPPSTATNSAYWKYWEDLKQDTLSYNYGAGTFSNTWKNIVAIKYPTGYSNIPMFGLGIMGLGYDNEFDNWNILDSKFAIVDSSSGNWYRNMYLANNPDRNVLLDETNKTSRNGWSHFDNCYFDTASTYIGDGFKNINVELQTDNAKVSFNQCEFNIHDTEILAKNGLKNLSVAHCSFSGYSSTAINFSGGSAGDGFVWLANAHLDGGDVNFPANTISGMSGSGTVTDVSVVSTNGFNGSVATATTTPAISIGTTFTGIAKSSAGQLGAATSGSDYQAPISTRNNGTTEVTFKNISSDNHYLASSKYMAVGKAGTPVAGSIVINPSDETIASGTGIALQNSTNDFLRIIRNGGAVINGYVATTSNNLSIRGTRARGTISSPTATQTGDTFLSVGGRGFNSYSTIGDLCAMKFKQDGAVAAGTIPSSIELWTGSTAGNTAARLIIDSAGSLTFAPHASSLPTVSGVKPGTFYNTTSSVYICMSSAVGKKAWKKMTLTLLEHGWPLYGKHPWMISRARYS